MTVQEKALHAYYGSLTDPELLKLAANRSSFIETAQQVMAQELLARHLTVTAAAAPLSGSTGEIPEPRPHGLRELAKRLVGVRRQRT